MSSQNPERVKVLEDGPYEVSGNVPLNQLNLVPDAEGACVEYAKQKDYEDQPVYHLCRCGMSNDKPYCDGSHYHGFESRETAEHKTYDEMAGFIQGEQIDLLDAEILCAVGRFCDTNGTTWDLVKDKDNPKIKDIVIDQCCKCPSGRLTAVTKYGQRIEPRLPKEISVLEDPDCQVRGPIWVKGGIIIEDAEGGIYPVRNRVTLCRCGKSQNKPFCDARHMDNEGETAQESDDISLL
ncbi:CDGSH iron-sulfur domain-containing protein [Prevotella sp. 10(H)]|uniref:CDGSH iron-sulfur domain-containing protein n=1 Tax=Prevotella sp. 10(H) TaxID=1158294 RepID=UPI00068DB524|nr:CDGSH iron-sulfur domain-containing protein [Prevotella sp. 10(H)]